MLFRLYEPEGFDFVVEANSKEDVDSIFGDEHYICEEVSTFESTEVYDLEDAFELFGHDDH